MNLYLNDEKVLLFKKMLDDPQILAMSDEYSDFIQELKSKISKKKIDKKAIVPSHLEVDKNGRELLFYPRKDNGAIMLKANKQTFPIGHGGAFVFEWSLDATIRIANYLHDYAVFTGDDDYQIYQKAYSEEFSVCKDEVERSINVSGSRFSFLCYTGNEKEDDWTYLSPGRVKETLRILYAYIFRHGDMEEHLEKMHPGVQEKRKIWLAEYSF